MAKNGSEAARALLNDHAAGHDLVLVYESYAYIYPAAGGDGTHFELDSNFRILKTFAVNNTKGVDDSQILIVGMG